MAYERILVPLDGTELAEKALPYAKNIAKLKGSTLILFAVSLTIFAERRDRLYSSYLEVKAKELNDEGIKTTTATSHGYIAQEIVKFAQENIDLIVMATHSYSGAKHWMFGSVTQKVLFGTEIPVLLVKGTSPELSGEFNRILIPLDGSPFSEASFPYIEELTRNTDREVILLHICEPPLVPSYGSRPINQSWKKHRDNMWEEMEKLATNYLTTKMTALKKKGVNVKTRVVKAQSGEVVKTIMQVSKEENIDLIVVATQGRAGERRWVYGNVANKIVEEISQPLLLVRPPKSVPLSHPENILDDIWNSYITSKG
ncbi:MAG: universal stress protein [Dehalococcoidia bacterium]